jgi:phage shock protein A
VLTSLEQKVKEFDKTAKYMIKKLDQTKTKIEQCDDGQTKIKLIELISQGDTLILETHGKSQELSDRLNNTQISLRNKYKEMQQMK